MSAELALRLAWHYDCQEEWILRDRLLTLAVVESTAADMEWAEPCRRFLAKRGGHPFAKCVTISLALRHPGFREDLRKLRLVFPPSRLLWLVERYEVARGPYRGQPLPAALLAREIVTGRNHFPKSPSIPAIVSKSPKQLKIPTPAPEPKHATRWDQTHAAHAPIMLPNVNLLFPRAVRPLSRSFRVVRSDDDRESEYLPGFPQRTDPFGKT